MPYVHLYIESRIWWNLTLELHITSSYLIILANFHSLVIDLWSIGLYILEPPPPLVIMNSPHLVLRHTLMSDYTYPEQAFINLSTYHI